jgi:hypothetical protein
MTITLPLQPQEEATLLALAQAKGVSTTTLVQEAIHRMLSESDLQPNAPKEPTISVRGILAKYGPAPSADEINQNRAEMLANFPRDDF